MGDLQSVRPPPTLLSGHGALIGGLLVVALLVAMLKPWGPGETRPTIAEATPRPTLSPTSTPGPQTGYSDLENDPSIFGDSEPPAVWGLWPTGFLVTLGFVSQIPDGAPAAASVSPSGGPSAAPGASAGSAPSAVGPSQPVPTTPDDGGPTWPARFDVPDRSHLLLVGIDMPRGFAVESATLERLAANGSLVAVPVERFPSPWPAQFAVVGLPPRANDRHLEVWSPGHYRLNLSFGPGGIRRSMDIVIAQAPPSP